MSPATLLTRLNELGKENGIGRLDLVENRFVGMKSRGIYETPGGTILYAAHRGIESITLDRGAGHLKDELMPKYAELIYYGFWYSPEREMLQALIDKSQENVTGTVRLKLYKGNTTVVGRKSPKSLYSMKTVTFEDDAGAYDQRDAEGFIKLNALRLQAARDGAGWSEEVVIAGGAPLQWRDLPVHRQRRATGVARPQHELLRAALHPRRLRRRGVAGVDDGVLVDDAASHSG